MRFHQGSKQVLTIFDLKKLHKAKLFNFSYYFSVCVDEPEIYSYVHISHRTDRQTDKHKRTDIGTTIIRQTERQI